jgi:hypothetical protein
VVAVNWLRKNTSVDMMYSLLCCTGNFVKNIVCPATKNGTNIKVKLLWDFDIQTYGVIQARRPDIVVVEKENKKTWIIDVNVPADRRIELKEMENIEKYQAV